MSFARIKRALRPRAVRIGLKTLIVALLLGVLAWNVDIDELRTHLARLTWQSTAIVLIALVVQFPLSAWKWAAALRIYELRFPFGHLLRAGCVGFFINNFLPTSIGGDAYRILRTIPDDPPRSRGASAVILERMVGFAALLSLGFPGALLLWGERPFARAYALVFVAGGVCAFAVLFSVYRGWFKWLTSRLRGTRAFSALEQNWLYLLRGGAKWAPFVALSALFQTVAIGIVYLLFDALGAEASAAQCALIAAAAGIAALVPLSINGIGITEATFAGTAVAVGVPYESGLLVSILMRLLVLPLSLACGLLYLAEPRVPTGPVSGKSALR